MFVYNEASLTKRDIRQVETFNALWLKLARVTDKEFDVVKKGMLPYSTIIKKSNE